MALRLLFLAHLERSFLQPELNHTKASITLSDASVPDRPRERSLETASRGDLAQLSRAI